MTLLITDYYLLNVNDPTKVSSKGLTDAGYTSCQRPASCDFRKAYLIATDLVGSKNFLTINTDMFWFESAAVAVQFRLLL
jgi:hypothetical protein